MHCDNPHPRLEEIVDLLRRLISTPSLSREESECADIWESWLKGRGAEDTRRLHNNVYSVAPSFDSRRPTLMLNSHLDTVRPSASYTRDPYSADIDGDRLYGLGSNDAGASGVALAATFIDLMQRNDLPFNLILAITAEEEVMGEKGMRAFLPHLAEEGISPDMVIVGEPTGMQPAEAERGLLVLDAVAQGKAGHAARDEGVNAIYLAISDIGRLRQFAPPKVSEALGPIKLSVTMINAGSQHNVVPDRCTYVIDVRTTDAYSNAETVELLREAVRHSQLTPRSTRVQASVISRQHPLLKNCEALGLTPFVSPTTSDRALMHGLPALKIGPGESVRSHSADEYVLISELNDALFLYPRIIAGIKKFM